MTDLISGKYEGIEFVVNGHTFNISYWLVDGIYPEWACFVQSLSEPGNEAEILFSKLVDAIRKDIERAFGILQARFKILCRGLQAVVQGRYGIHNEGLHHAQYDCGGRARFARPDPCK